MKLLTTKEVAERLHLHRKTVETYLRAGYIKARTYAVEEERALVERAACPLLSGQAAHCTRPSPIIA